MGKRLFSVVPVGVSGISCSPDGFAVIQGGRKMMTQTDISATRFKGTGTPYMPLAFQQYENARK